MLSNIGEKILAEERYKINRQFNKPFEFAKLKSCEIMQCKDDLQQKTTNHKLFHADLKGLSTQMQF